jgi:curved DNA-binding protein CbpA/RNA polymerase subunit RPABC4/transcription elongation factor Spt4
MTTSDDYRRHCQVLGVPEGASDAEVKKAYHRQAQRWHPDNNPGDHGAAEARMKEINEAYELIRGKEAGGGDAAADRAKAERVWREAEAERARAERDRRDAEERERANRAKRDAEERTRTERAWREAEERRAKAERAERDRRAAEEKAKAERAAEERARAERAWREAEAERARAEKAWRDAEAKASAQRQRMDGTAGGGARGQAGACAGCGVAVPAGSRFCPNCGTPAGGAAPGRCARCGMPVPAGGRFCPACGAPADGPGGAPWGTGAHRRARRLRESPGGYAWALALWPPAAFVLSGAMAAAAYKSDGVGVAAVFLMLSLGVEAAMLVADARRVGPALAQGGRTRGDTPVALWVLCGLAAPPAYLWRRAYVTDRRYGPLIAHLSIVSVLTALVLLAALSGMAGPQ